MFRTMLHRRMPQELCELYRHLGLAAFLYMEIRWFFSYFEETERYIPAEGKILDAGCGYGLFTNFVALRNQYRSLTGIDISSKRILLAAKTVQKRNNINFLTRDLYAFDFSGYDTVMFHDVLHHFSYLKQNQLLRKIHDRMRPQGLVVIKEFVTSPRRKYYLGYTLDRLLYFPQRIYYRSCGQWQKMLEDIGFRTEVKPLQAKTIFSPILFICRKL